MNKWQNHNSKLLSASDLLQAFLVIYQLGSFFTPFKNVVVLHII